MNFQNGNETPLAQIAGTKVIIYLYYILLVNYESLKVFKGDKK